MRNRLVDILGCPIKASEWLNTPISEWMGFTVNDMTLLFNFHVRVMAWFNNLTDEQIIAISQEKPLCFQSSPQ